MTTGRAELAVFFLICAALPVVFIHSVGADEQFYLVKAAALEVLVCALAALRLAGAAFYPGAAAKKIPALVIIAVLLPSAWFAASLFYAANKSDTLNSLAYFYSLLAVFYLAATFPDRDALKKAAVAGTLVGAAVASFYGILDFLNLTGPALFIDWGDRTASLFSDPNFFGAYLLFPLMIGAGGLLFGDKNGKRFARAFYLILTLLCSAAMLLSNSRSAWISCAAGIALFCVAAAVGAKGGLLKRIKPAVSVLALVLAIGVVGYAGSKLPHMRTLGFNFGSRVKSISVFLKEEADARRYLWISAEGMIADRPAQGFGLGSFYREYHPYQLKYKQAKDFPSDAIKHSAHTYNDYLEIGSETGIVGLVLWAMMLVFLVTRAMRGAMRAGPAAVAAVAASFAFFLDGALFQYPVYNAAGAALAFLWIGIFNEPAKEMKKKIEAGVIDESVEKDAAKVPVQTSPSPSPAGSGLARSVALLIPAAALILVAVLWVPRPVRGYAMYNRAETLIKANKPADALALLKKALALQPDRPFFHFQEAQAYMALPGAKPDASKQAESELNEALRLYPFDSHSHFLLGEILLGSGRADQAMKQFELAEKYEYGDTKYIEKKKVSALSTDKNFEQAIKQLDDIIKTTGATFNAENDYAIEHKLRERIKAAGMNPKIFTPDELGHIKSLNRSRVELASSLGEKGRLLIQTGKPDQALKPLKLALKLMPKNEKFQYWLSEACRKSGTTGCESGN